MKMIDSQILVTCKRIPRRSFFSQVALATGVLTSSWGVRVHRFCGFVARGGCHTGCRWRCRLVCRGQGSQIQDRAVWLYFISVFWFVSCPEIYLWKKIYLVNRLFQQMAENRWYLSMLFGVYAGFPIQEGKKHGPAFQFPDRNGRDIPCILSSSDPNKTRLAVDSLVPGTPLAPREGASKPHKCTKGFPFCPPR